MKKLLISSLTLGVALGAAAATTYCNPMALPNVPVSCNCRNPRPQDADKEQFRELADPSLLVEDGKIYVYPSDGMAWRSCDGGATWEKLDVGVEDIGYAPTIVKHGDKYLLMSGTRIIYAASKPEGPFTRCAVAPEPPKGVPGMGDPMFFSEDGHLYLYFGCSEKDGIWGCEIDPVNFSTFVQEPRLLIPFEPETQAWECKPKEPKISWIEGSWMVKINGRYCLTYSSSGTEHARYAMGAAWSDSPLGTFVKQKKNPFFRKTTGLVTGIGHGSIVHGTRPGELLATYCIYSGVHHGFERLIGFDRLRLDANGDLAVQEATETPQFADGSGMVPWTTAPFKGPDPVFTDAKLQTFAAVGPLPATVPFKTDYSLVVRAYRLIWRDLGLNVQKGAKPGPYKYRVQYKDGETWKVLVDASDNATDLFIDYRETPAVRTSELRLVVLGAPAGITPAITEFTVFSE